MRIPAVAYSLIVAGLIVGYAGRASAQTCDRKSPVADAAAALAQVQTLDAAGCLGTASCDSPICKLINPVLAAKKPASQPTAAEVAKVLRALLEEGKGGQATEQGRRLLTQMGITLAQFAENGRTAAAAWTIEDLSLFKDEPYAIDVGAWVKACSDRPDCTAASAQAQQVIELATLVRRILIKANEPVRNAFAAHLQQLDVRWRAYLGSARGQYPWELEANSRRYRKTAQFDAPPTWQWILAHPGAGYELTRGAPDRQPSESLLLEMVGVYRWSWKDDRMIQRWGGSLALAWRDAGRGRQKLGYGVLAYLPRASTVGYVWRPQDNGADEHSLVLSADLVKFIRGTQGIKERLIGAGSSR